MRTILKEEIKEIWADNDLKIRKFSKLKANTSRNLIFLFLFLISVVFVRNSLFCNYTFTLLTLCIYCRTKTLNGFGKVHYLSRDCDKPNSMKLSINLSYTVQSSFNCADFNLLRVEVKYKTGFKEKNMNIPESCSFHHKYYLLKYDILFTYILRKWAVPVLQFLENWYFNASSRGTNVRRCKLISSRLKCTVMMVLKATKEMEEMQIS